MNFDWRAVSWVIRWVDATYSDWGSPTCPLEAHCHVIEDRHSWTGDDVGHSVRYSDR